MSLKKGLLLKMCSLRKRIPLTILLWIVLKYHLRLKLKSISCENPHGAASERV